MIGGLSRSALRGERLLMRFSRAVLATHSVHAFGETAFFNETFCQAREMTVEQRTCYRDED